MPVLSERYLSLPSRTGDGVGKLVRRGSYLPSYFRFLAARCCGGVRKPEVDLAFVLPPDSGGWILEAICREIAVHFSGTCRYAETGGPLPSAKSYFFPHYSFLRPILKKNPQVWASKRVVLFTHPKEPRLGSRTIALLDCATTVVSMCTLYERLLLSQGVAPERLTTILMGADANLFQPHTRRNGAVGFCAAYYPRKEPHRIKELIEAMPHRQFVLLGRKWRQFEHFATMESLPNFTYLELPYAEYPRFYERIDVFVSPARVEGGPIPLLEAMMANAVPVASRTGFAPDIIRHGQNGFLFDVDADVPEICARIEDAYALRTFVRESVEHLTWQRFTTQLQQHF